MLAALGGLEFDVEDEQIANEAMLEKQLARGAFDAAEDHPFDIVLVDDLASTADVGGFMDADCATDLTALVDGARLLSAGADVAIAWCERGDPPFRETLGELLLPDEAYIRAEVIHAVRSELALTLQNDPAAQLNEQAAAALYANHPYRIPIIGWAHEIETLSRDDLIAFYRTWYAPNNAIIVISGDVKMADVKPMVDEKMTSTSPCEMRSARRKYCSSEGPRITPIRMAANSRSSRSRVMASVFLQARCFAHPGPRRDILGGMHPVLLEIGGLRIGSYGLRAAREQPG